MAVTALIDRATAGGDDIGRVEAAVHGVGLAGIDHEEHLVIAPLLPHLLEGVGEIPGADLLAVLELEELVAAVAGHVDEDVAAAVGAEALAARDFGREPVGEEADEGFDGHFVASVVDFDVVAVEIQGAVGVVVDRAGEGVAWVAGHVVGEHEDDLAVRDAEAFDGAVEGEHVCEVPVVEPEAGGGDEDGPVGGVLGIGWERVEEGENG